MKTAMNIVGVLLAVVGVVWILQGIGILPGSFMTGQLQWAFYGVAALVAGCLALYLGRRNRG